MASRHITSSSDEYVHMPSRNEQSTDEDSFQTKKELYSIYLQEAKLRKELDFAIDEDKPSPLRTYQRLGYELAERRKFLSFNGPTSRCKSLPSIYNPGLTTQKQLATAMKDETTISQTRGASKWQELAQCLQSIKEGTISDQRLRKTALCDDAANRPVTNRAAFRRRKSDAPRRAQQQWKITIHKRLPTVI